MAPHTVLLEACVDSVDAAIAAERGGARRVELCSALDVGGTTPPAELIEQVVGALSIPVVVIVRTRGGDFVHETPEVDEMAAQIALVKSLGVQGIATGALRTNGTIDDVTLSFLVDMARPLTVTFHRAFDETRDLPEALSTLLAIGVDRVLTSGGAATALEGVRRIAELVQQAGEALTVVAAGSVRTPNASEIVHRTGVREVHARTANEFMVRRLTGALRAGFRG